VVAVCHKLFFTGGQPHEKDAGVYRKRQQDFYRS